MTISATTPGDLPTQALSAPLSPEPGAGSEEAGLAALAAALTAFGCQADLMVPRLCLAIRPPGALARGLVCAARPHFHLPSTGPAGSRAEIGLAAENHRLGAARPPHQRCSDDDHRRDIPGSSGRQVSGMKPHPPAPSQTVAHANATVSPIGVPS